MVILKVAPHLPALTVFCFCAVKGIYRVNGAKSRVEKLCQAFENGKHLVELSELYPHDIGNVLKLYLRQVGCFGNLIFYTYCELIYTCKDSCPDQKLKCD